MHRSQGASWDGVDTAVCRTENKKTDVDIDDREGREEGGGAHKSRNTHIQREERKKRKGTEGAETKCAQNVTKRQKRAQESA